MSSIDVENATLTVNWYVRHELASITPNSASPGGLVPCTITGIGFHTDGDANPATVITALQFRRSGFEDAFIDFTSFTVVNDTTITATIPPALLAPIGVYDLLATVDDDEFPEANPIVLFSGFQYVANQWCYNPTSNHYVYAPTCPGPPFVTPESPPVPAITSFRPRST